MRHWWVNHNQTGGKEVDGGFLWSPKTEANGNRSQFYDNMRRVRPGDGVLSYMNQRVSHVGKVCDYAFGSPKPLVFGGSGTNWSEEGWLLPLVWQQSPNTFSPREFLDELKHLLPRKYSPINAGTGGGNQKAYLAEISSELFEFVKGKCGAVDSSQDQSTIGGSSLHVQADDDCERFIVESDDLDASEKRELIKARRGQGTFRRNVFRIENCCRVTRLTTPWLLTASHIKPWRSCNSNSERLDGNNGLLLTPHVDQLFDRGLISFSDKGQVIVSPDLPRHAIDRLGLMEMLEANVGEFSTRQKEFLAYHREVILIC